MTKPYIFANDIAFCRDCDIGGLASDPCFAAIRSLHQRLAERYPPDEEAAAA